MGTLVRKANIDDAEKVAAVLNAVIAEGKFTLFDKPFSAEDERNFISSLGPRSALYVAEIDGEVTGVQSIDLFSGLARSICHVATMGTWLRGDLRGRGLGRILAAESFRFAKSNGYTKVIIHVLADNEGALRFYRNLGFRDIGVARQHVRIGDRFHDEVFLEKLF